MNKVFLTTPLLITSLLVACESADETPNAAETNEATVSQKEAPKEEEVSQDKLNEELKREATAIDFVAANTGEVSENERVKLEGEISVLSPEGLRGGDFTLTTTEGDGYGMYNVINMNTVEIPIQEGDAVTVYGVFNGKDSMGLPEVTAIVIE